MTLPPCRPVSSRPVCRFHLLRLRCLAAQEICDQGVIIRRDRLRISDVRDFSNHAK